MTTTKSIYRGVCSQAELDEFREWAEQTNHEPRQEFVPRSDSTCRARYYAGYNSQFIHGFAWEDMPSQGTLFATENHAGGYDLELEECVADSFYRRMLDDAGIRLTLVENG